MIIIGMNLSRGSSCAYWKLSPVDRPVIFDLPFSNGPGIPLEMLNAGSRTIFPHRLLPSVIEDCAPEVCDPAIPPDDL